MFAMTRKIIYGKKGQSTLEYALLIAVVVGALLAMQPYLKRGVQGNLRDSSDQIGTQYSRGGGSKSYRREATEEVVDRGGTRTTTTEGEEFEEISVSIGSAGF